MSKTNIIISIFVLFIVAIIYRSFYTNKDYSLLSYSQSDECNKEQIALMKAYSNDYIRIWIRKNRKEVKNLKLKWLDNKGKFNCNFYAVKNGFIEAKIGVEYSDDEGTKEGTITYRLSRNTFLKTLKQDIVDFFEMQKKPTELKQDKNPNNGKVSTEGKINPTPKKKGKSLTKKKKKKSKKEPTTKKKRNITTSRFIDRRDGHIYKTIKIGTQVWMAENLAYKTSKGSWASNNDENNVGRYGRLYNFETAKKVCPTGWHLPSDEEWKTLEMHLGMSQSEADGISWRGTNEGSKMVGNAALWNNGNLKNDPEFSTSGLSFLPVGYRYTDGSFYFQSYAAYLWSSSENGSNAKYRGLYYDSTGVGRNDDNKAYGFSVRCVRD